MFLIADKFKTHLNTINNEQLFRKTYSKKFGGKIMKSIKYLIIMLISSGCSSVILQPADFSWPIESVLKVNDKGYVTEDRYSFKINVKPLFQEEFADSTNTRGREIRIIRDEAGYYYITGTDFKNVYLFLPVNNGVKMESKISISDSLALSAPAFNQKQPNIELIDGTKKYLLNNNGIARLK